MSRAESSALAQLHKDMGVVLALLADKGKPIVILDTCFYEDKMLVILSDTL